MAWGGVRGWIAALARRHGGRALAEAEEDARVARVKIKIVKLAIAENGESIGITLTRHRK